MPEAKYTILVPRHDDQGNILIPIAGYAREYLNQLGIMKHIYVEDSFTRNEQDSLQSIVVVADDTPEVDSTIKQTASYLGELVNRWGIAVFKEGKDGIRTWEIANTNYRPDEPAKDELIDLPTLDQVNPGTPATSGPVNVV